MMVQACGASSAVSFCLEGAKDRCPWSFLWRILFCHGLFAALSIDGNILVLQLNVEYIGCLKVENIGLLLRIAC